jgi:Na+-driven multidrug efflux pump
MPLKTTTTKTNRNPNISKQFCLTTLDVATPAIAVAAASIINVIGDLALSPTYGIQGAAVATAMATITSCLILLRKVRKTTTEWKTNQEKYEAKARVVSATTTAATNTEAIKDDKKSDHVPFCSLPNKSSMIDLFKLAGPIFFVMMAKVACYNVMTIRATNFGIIPLASHNIMMRIFFFFACFGDSLSQAAQSFYPQVSKKMRGKLIKRLFYIASAVGICNFNMSQLILSKLGRFLAKDSNIIHLMAQHSPWVGYAVLLHPFIMLLEGTVLAKRDLVFMVATYVITSLLHFAFVFSPVSSSFVGLWRALFGFQLIRLVQFALRVWTKSRRRNKENNNIGSVEQEGIIPAPPL